MTERQKGSSQVSVKGTLRRRSTQPSSPQKASFANNHQRTTTANAMTTQQKAIQKAIEINSEIDALFIEKALLEQAHAKALKELDNKLCILRSSLSTVLAIANQ